MRLDSENRSEDHLCYLGLNTMLPEGSLGKFNCYYQNTIIFAKNQTLLCFMAYIDKI